MNFLNIDFGKGTTALFKEAFKFKKYKAMPLAFAIIVGIFQIPFTLVSFVVAGFIYLINFIMKLFAFPVEQIHGVVRGEKDEVKAGAQTVIYLISWPLIFFSYVLLIFSTFMLNILYIIVAVTTFIWTLGGFRFHLLLSDAGDIEKTVEGKYNKNALIVYVVVIAVIIVLVPIVLTMVEYLGLSPQEKQLNTLLNPNYLIDLYKENLIMSIYVTLAFSFLYTLFAFVPFPKKGSNVAPAIAEVVAEAAVVEEIPVVVEEAPAEEEAPEKEEAPVEE